jgi:DNA-binding CsgD family transcriptional regulator/tetratricopeptide (TPR) repeat protein
MELLERHQQLSELSARLIEVRRGKGCLALVSGEAGIGKTSLLEQFTRQLDKTTRLFWGRCDLLFTPRPLGPLHDMAPQIGGEVLELLEAQAPRDRIFSAFLEELEHSPTIAIFEDVHWADEATLDLLLFIGRRIGQTAALLLLTYRDDELSPRHPLHTLLGDLVSSATMWRIPLPRLSAQAVQALVGEQAIDADELYQQTGGNPFYVTEVLANPESGIPATVRDAVLARAARLSTSGYAVLEAAAVIGQRVEPRLLALVTGAETYAVEESMAVGMLHGQEGLLVFRHELARETILRTISPHRRQALHRLVLDALKSSPATRDDLARLVHHAEAAGDREAILAYAPEAAHQASKAGAHRGAAALFKLTLEYAEDMPIQDRAALWEAYSLECDVIDQRPAAIAALRQCAELWREAGNALKCGDSLGKLALLLQLVGEVEEAEQINDSAIHVLEELPPNRELVIVYNSQAWLCLARMENQKGVELAEKAIALINQLEDYERLPRLYEILGLCWLYLEPERGIELLERSLALGLEFNQTMRVANSYANLGSVYVEFHQLEAAEECLAKGLAYAAERELEFARMYMLAWQAQLQLYYGRWDEAAETASLVLQQSGTSIGSRAPALMALGQLRARRGDPGADEALNESLELLISLGFRQREGLVRAARAEAAWLAGDPGRCVEEARSVYDLAISERHPWMVGELAFWRWRAGDEVETPEWMARPFALQLAGDWQAAAGAWEQLGCPYERARALSDGDTQAQITALQVFEQLGARPDADLLRDKLQATGVLDIPRRPHPSTRENPFGLTNRQVEVLALLIEGQTNAEIAASLYISQKTAEHHVSAILARLDVPSREEAARLASDHPYFHEN